MTLILLHNRIIILGTYHNHWYIVNSWYPMNILFGSYDRTVMYCLNLYHFLFYIVMVFMIEINTYLQHSDEILKQGYNMGY